MTMHLKVYEVVCMSGGESLGQYAAKSESAAIHAYSIDAGYESPMAMYDALGSDTEEIQAFEILSYDDSDFDHQPCGQDVGF